MPLSVSVARVFVLEASDVLSWSAWMEKEAMGKRISQDQKVQAGGGTIWEARPWMRDYGVTCERSFWRGSWHDSLWTASSACVPFADDGTLLCSPPNFLQTAPR